ncbi:unnamed protein product [Symbiodinium sp. CCMP2456]|nr:unnamed protein product [Symbiodinium sp. CCMP2456]
MWAEDRVAQGWRLYEARRQSHEVARCLAKETGEDLQALRRSKGHVSEEVAKEVLAEQQQRIETLKQDARAQDEKLLSLRADLSSVLDFIALLARASRAKVHPEIQPKRGRADLQQVFQAFPEYDVPVPTAPNRRTESHHSKEPPKARDSKPKPCFQSLALPTEDSEEAEWSSWDSAEWRDNHSEKPQPPGRRLHDRHVRRLNEFRTRLEERPQLLEKMVERRRSLSP